ncbi:MAG: hypothetical protein IPK79_07785 [Vampirovibrionales bacterium]|nr:hypothetical protein [Vampirovibrionales bacterium]
MGARYSRFRLTPQPTRQGFPQLGARSESAALIPSGVQLVAREDIVVVQGGRSVLLARAGMSVSEELLPKLIRYGAEPSQFILEESAPTAAKASAPSLRPLRKQDESSQASAMMNPVRSRPTQARNWHSILVIESDERACRRVSDALTLCGVRSKDIHLARSGAHLQQALQAFSPSVLIVSDAIHPVTSIIAYLRRLREESCVERVGLISSLSRLQEAERRKLLALASGSGVHVLFRPITPFSLTPLLEEYRARLSMLRSAHENA